MNLNEILKIQKGLPPSDLHSLLFARKLINFQETTVTGYPCVLENSAGKPVINYKISGNIVQNSTPSPENPVEVHGVGDLITEGENSGKYVIPVVTKSANHNPINTSIYLSEPLYKGDYISKDKSGGKVHRAWGVKVLEGSKDEGIVLATSPMNTWLRYPFGIYISNLKIDYGANTQMYSDKMINNTTSENTTSANEYMTFRKTVDATTRVWLFVPLKILGDEEPNANTAIEKFKLWLSDNPLTIYYPLATPTEESIELPEIPTFDDTTIIETATEIQPENMEITYKSRR